MITMAPKSLLARLLMLLFVASLVSAKMRPRLGVISRTKFKGVLHPISSISASSKSMVFFNYTQTLDHFNYRPDSFTSFQQRYIVNSRHWGGANTSSPIFVYLGAESSIDAQIDTILDYYGPKFNALLVYIEHRYYGSSVPFGSWEEAFSNTTTLGYFNSAQALADYAELIYNLKSNLSAETCPVIVIGGSYGGMLASWFRLKYPHIAIGALASSAPILDTDNILPEDYVYVIVSKDFQEASKSCYDTIQQSWSIIDSHDNNDLAFLTQKFKLCDPLNSSSELKDYLETIYCYAAQYDTQYDYAQLPISLVDSICQGVDGVSNESDILTRIVAGLDSYRGKQSCYDINENYPPNDRTILGWNWQICTDMITASGRTRNNTMFQISPYDQNEFIEECRQIYGATVTPRPHWIATEFGGHDIKTVLQKFGSNIIFSNGLRDPLSGGGVLWNISDSLVAIYTNNGSHCLDIQPESGSEPAWLLAQRNSEIEIMQGWISEYNSMRK